MATPRRRNAIDLIQELKRSPHRFWFFQAIRLLVLEEKRKGQEASIPKRLRFRTPASLAFPPSEILAYRVPEPPVAPASAPLEEKREASRHSFEEMEVSFLGLIGPSGVLPSHYTELLQERQSIYKDTSAHAFFDIFSHRAISLFFASWQKYRFHLSIEQGRQGGFTQHVQDLLGIAHPLGRLSKKRASAEEQTYDQVLAYFSGFLGMKPLPSPCLAALVGHYFHVPVQLEQFVGQWVEIPSGECTSLGSEGFCLGKTSFLGTRIWDQQTKIRLRIGPVGPREFAGLLPGSSGAKALHDLVKMCVGPCLSCDVTLLVERQNTSSTVLGSAADLPPRLGFNAWANNAHPGRGLDEVNYRLLA